MTNKEAFECIDQMFRHYQNDFGYYKPTMNRMEEAREIAACALLGEPTDLTVRINTHGSDLPEVHGEWIDLALAEDVEMQSGEFRILSLGVSMELPSGYYAKIVPRSSTCKKWGIMLANSVGIIENEYCGDNDIWGFPAYAIRDTKIPKGTRICQFCVCKKELQVKFDAVEALGNQDRGGYGSTGD